MHNMEINNNVNKPRDALRSMQSELLRITSRDRKRSTWIKEQTVIRDIEVKTTKMLVFHRKKKKQNVR